MLAAENCNIPVKPAFIQLLEVLLPSTSSKTPTVNTASSSPPDMPIIAKEESTTSQDSSWNEILSFLDTGADDWDLILSSGGQTDLNIRTWE